MNRRAFLQTSLAAGGVDEILRARFPKLKIAKSKAEKEAALAECEFFLHGFGGVTLKDGEIKDQRDLPAGAQFVFLRDTD